MKSNCYLKQQNVTYPVVFWWMRNNCSSEQKKNPDFRYSLLSMICLILSHQRMITEHRIGKRWALVHHFIVFSPYRYNQIDANNLKNTLTVKYSKITRSVEFWVFIIFVQNVIYLIVCLCNFNDGCQNPEFNNPLQEEPVPAHHWPTAPSLNSPQSFIYFPHFAIIHFGGLVRKFQQFNPPGLSLIYSKPM